MKRKVLLSFAFAAAAALAASKSYSIQLFEPAMAGNTELQPGQYKVEVVDQKAVIRNGKTDSESPVKVEDGDRKYDSTTVKYNQVDGKLHILEIRLGGTKTKLVFADASTPAGN
jgi:hypothetical protein